MTLIWLSPGLPVDPDALATDLGPTVQIASQAFPPPGAALAVATVFERDLIARLASVPGAGATLLLKPAGSATPVDLPRSDGPLDVVEATDVGEVSAGIRRALGNPGPPWPSAAALMGAGGGWATTPTDAVEPATAQPPMPAPIGQPSRRRWLASGGVVAAAALAAVVVLATQGGASDATATGFRGGAPGGTGGYGAPGAALGSPFGGGTGTADPQQSAERQAFLACLQENGVDTSAMTSGQRPRMNPSDPATAAAFQACRSLLPQPRAGSGGPGSGGPGMGAHDGDRDSDGTRPGMPGTPGTAPGADSP